MDLSQNLSHQLSQRLTLTKEMLVAIELMQLPLLDLKERIEKEILENPALEIEESKNESKNSENIESIENTFVEDPNYFEDSSSADIKSSGNSNSYDSDSKRQFLEGAISYKENLYNHLMWQLNMSTLNEEKKRIGEIIISLIDQDGFFKQNLEEIFPYESKIAKDVLESIQLFDPPGVGSFGVKEALLFQIESLPENKINKDGYNIIKYYFDLMVERKDSVIMKNLRINQSQLKDAYNFLTKFELYPGRKYSNEEPRYIIPDANIYKRENELFVEINDDILPHLTVSGYMNKIANEVKKKRKIDEQKKYVVEKVGAAKKFIKTIKHRKRSLFRLVLAIVKEQEEFFYKGPKFLKPLTMKVVAEEIGLSESTISRLASSKYIQTEWGIHEIKYFFSSSSSRSKDSDAQSSESIRETIKEIIQSEKNGKITDQKISEILENKGIKIARRTVSKYRKMLDILPSSKRNL